jgi:hypothetical protein
MTDIAIVVPTIRETCIKRWLTEWQGHLNTAQIYVVEDNPESTFDIKDCVHYSWKDIEKELGSESWIIPRRTSAIKAYGFLKAYQDGADIIWTLDDDCYPEAGRIDYLDNI